MVSENIATAKMVKKYSLNLVIKFLDIKIILHEKTYNTYKKSGVNMATADKLVNYMSKISKKTYKKNTEIKSFMNIAGFGSIFDLSELK